MNNVILNEVQSHKHLGVTLVIIYPVHLTLKNNTEIPIQVGMKRS